MDTRAQGCNEKSKFSAEISTKILLLKTLVSKVLSCAHFARNISLGGGIYNALDGSEIVLFVLKIEYL